MLINYTLKMYTNINCQSYDLTGLILLESIINEYNSHVIIIIISEPSFIEMVSECR